MNPVSFTNSFDACVGHGKTIDVEYYRKKFNGRGLDMRKGMETDGFTRAEIDAALKAAGML